MSCVNDVRDKAEFPLAATGILFHFLDKAPECDNALVVWQAEEPRFYQAIALLRFCFNLKREAAPVATYAYHRP